MKEVWKDISGYESRYQISNYGRVKSLYRPGVFLSPQKWNKYRTVHLSKKGEDRVYSIHRLVAEAFIPNPNNYPFVNHIDGNTTNNCVDNLEWCTAKMNSEHATKHNLNKPTVKKTVLTSIESGEKITFNSINEAAKYLGYSCGAGLYRIIKNGIVKNGYKVEIEIPGKIKYPVYQFSLSGGEYLKMYPCIQDAENMTSISSDTIRMCCCHKIKSAGGYLWSFSPNLKQPYSTTERDLSASRKKVGQYNMSGELINTYDSITEASNAVKCTISNIGHSLNGRTKSAAGYIWKYIDARRNAYYGDEDKADL